MFASDEHLFQAFMQSRWAVLAEAMELRHS